MFVKTYDYPRLCVNICMDVWEGMGGTNKNTYVSIVCVNVGPQMGNCGTSCSNSSYFVSPALGSFRLIFSFERQGRVRVARGEHSCIISMCSAKEYTGRGMLW